MSDLEYAHSYSQWFQRDVLQNAAGYPINNTAFNPRHMIGHPNFRHVTHWLANSRSFFGDTNQLTTDVVMTGAQPQQRSYQATLYDRYHDLPVEHGVPHRRIAEEKNERNMLVMVVLIGLGWIYLRG